MGKNNRDLAVVITDVMRYLQVIGTELKMLILSTVLFWKYKSKLFRYKHIRQR